MTWEEIFSLTRSKIPGTNKTTDEWMDWMKKSRILLIELVVMKVINREKEKYLDEK